MVHLNPVNLLLRNVSQCFVEPVEALLAGIPLFPLEVMLPNTKIQIPNVLEGLWRRFFKIFGCDLFVVSGEEREALLV